MKNLSFTILVTLLIFSCQNGLEVDSSKHTATDPIADITYLKGYFYTTNLDFSTNSGPQIDLYKFDSTSFPANRFELDLNGQGYLAATNDGTNLYFQPRYTDYILKISPVGENFWYKSDYFPENTSDTTATFMYWSGRGITWADNILVVLYGHKDDSTLYRWRYLTVEDDFSTVKDTVVIWEHLNKSGAFALDYDPFTKEFLVAATDSTNSFILITLTSELEYENRYYDIPDSTLGITFGSNSKIYLSLPDRKIEEFTRPEG
ncbi:MAG: hypothetical protein H8E85_01080 [Candidatus Marinimicrobia bacterium]|nr:hypothetical protein [Candidatus Neomarinimicrobiota bacterium]